VLSHDVPCAGCRKSVCPLGHHACLRGVAPAEVVEAVRDLAGTPRRRASARPGAAFRPSAPGARELPVA
jgi:hypothetical protein